MDKTLAQHWADFIEEMVCADGYTCQLRKFVQGQTWVIPGDMWTEGKSLTFEQLDYTEKNKMAQLMRNYYNAESIAEANTKLLSRFDGKKYQTSVAASTVGGQKKGDSQGHCMRTVVVTHFTKSVAGQDCITIDVMYRSTELIKKFGADLIYLQKHLIPKIIEGVPYPIKEVRFYFSNLFVSSLFLPILYYMKDPVKLLEKIRQADPEFYKRCFSQNRTFLEKEYGHFSYRTRREMHHLALTLMEKGVIDRKALTKYISKMGKDIPDIEGEDDDE
jgi:hypothetical protein